MLNSMQKDVLTELVNVYIGQAASLLSEMVDQRVYLSVPHLKIVSPEEFSFSDCDSEHSFFSGHILSSSIKFGRDLQGKAMLIFPSAQAKLLAELCMRNMQYGINEKDSLEFLDTDFDVLKEISNLVLNAIIGGFGNLLEKPLEYSLPEIEMLFVSPADHHIIQLKEVYILIMHTSFMLDDKKINGAILIALSMNSISALICKIDRMLEE